MKSLLTLLLVVSACGFSQSQPLLLGVLEDFPSDSAKEGHHRATRVLFHKEGQDWVAFPTDCRREECLKTLPNKYPQIVHWTVAYDGRKIDELSAHTPSQWQSYWRIGEQEIDSSGYLPAIGKPSQQFAGFTGEPVLRPLVVISQPDYAEPEHWKPASTSQEERSLLRTAFRNKFPSVVNCKNDSSPPEAWPYTDADFRYGKAYASRTGWKIATLYLDAYRCDGIVDNPSNNPFGEQWFTIDPSGKVQFMSGNLVLVDAGDYDASGRSQLLFMIDDYNRGGYVLFYDNFQRHATFEYTFH